MPILAGFEIPTGRRIEIPAEGHLAWFGQTQLSGKTTALEAFVYRGKFKALAFITKQGEGSFLTGRQIQPYFSEPTNDPEQPMWRWVKAILEASQQRKLMIEESSIIRACEIPRHAAKLADVHHNIGALLKGEGHFIEKGRGKRKSKVWVYDRKPATGFFQSIYTSLNAYFDIVMPQLARLPYTTKLQLAPGLNVMDLREYAMETQALVIRSCLEWVYQHETNTRTIVPEAQDFVPQGKNSPVKMACETLVRKAGANKNFMWLDSQDMAAVDKVMLRACSVIGCGVQTEMHEIDRTLASMFTPALKPVDIAKLKVGEFFVRTPEATVSKVYIMPAWMDSEIHAQAIAKGEESVGSARLLLRKFAEARKDENHDAETESFKKESLSMDRGRMGTRLRAIPDQCDISRIEGDQSASLLSRNGAVAEETYTGDPMWKEKYEALEAEHKELIRAHDALAERLRYLEGKADIAYEHGPGAAKSSTRHSPLATSHSPSDGDEFETLYRKIVMRAKADPGILELLRQQPELRVKIERPVIEADASTLRGALALLLSKGFFDVPRNGNTAFNELKRVGQRIAKPNVYRELGKLAELGFLTDEEAGYQAVAGMKVQVRESQVADR